jgi:hypothetical protein
MNTIRRRVLVCLACSRIVWPSSNVTAREKAPARRIEPPDVYVLLGQVREELESIRFVMGRHKNEQPEIDVDRAAPREVYFQSLPMFRKAERLCFEQTREHVSEPKLPAGEIGAAVD